MKNATNRLLDALAAREGGATDYRLSQLLRYDRQKISRYRHGKEQFSDEPCIRIAKLLDRDPLEVMAEVNADKAKKPEVQQFWEKIGRAAKLSAAASIILLLSALTPSQPSEANNGVVFSDSNARVRLINCLYIMRRTVRRMILLAFRAGSLKFLPEFERQKSLHLSYPH